MSFLARWLICLASLAWCLSFAHADTPPDPARSADPTLSSRYWIDTTGRAGIDTVRDLPGQAWTPMERLRSFELGAGALWLEVPLPARDANQRWYLMLSAAAFINRATLYQPRVDQPDQVSRQDAGDQLPLSQWALPDQTPVFAVTGSDAQRVWLRLENAPAPTSPRLALLDERELQSKRYQTFLLVGAYLGACLLVLFLGVVHLRLYRDRAFLAYCAYVAAMLGFQLGFTGIGGLFVWGEWPRWNDLATAVFMSWLAAAGIWFVRETCALSRYSRWLDISVLAWCMFGAVFPALYATMMDAMAFRLLSLYGLLSVFLSIGLCLWAWRQGERYAGWLFLGFLPVHLAYPFPALRSAGVLPDSWITQYALLIGSMIEIPLLLYILHRRAKDFSEHHARMRAMESTDPLTGLIIQPVFMFRLRDTLRRARRHPGTRFGLLAVDLANHGELAEQHGREAADRALVIAGARLSSLAGDLDTVCRIGRARFAMLIEAPPPVEQFRTLAQQVVARGLEIAPAIGPQAVLKLRVATALPPDGVIDVGEEGPIDEQRLMSRLERALERGAADPRRVVQHLPSPTHGSDPAHSRP